MAQTLPALINGINPRSGLNSAAGAFGKAAMDDAANAPGAPPMAGALIGAAAGQAAINGGSAFAQTDATLPTDPAHAVAPLLAPFLNDMYLYLTHGPNDSIGWAKFKDSKKDEDGKVQQAHDLTWLLTNAEQQEKSAQLGTSEPSEEFESAFALKINTIEAIQAQVLKSSDMAASGTDAATIKTWQEDIKNAKAIALKLETTAKTSPGSSASTSQMRNLQIDVPKTDYSAQTAALNTATEKLAINQRGGSEA